MLVFVRILVVVSYLCLLLVVVVVLVIWLVLSPRPVILLVRMLAFVFVQRARVFRGVVG